MVYPLLRKILKFFLLPWTGRIKGVENIPRDKAVIFAANHASYLDHFIIGMNIASATDTRIRTLAKKEHFESFFQRLWHNYLDAIPVDRQSGGQEGLSKAIEALKNGNSIFIYPEGTRTLTGKMNQAKTGVARLALSAHVQVIPIGITNTFFILPKGKYLPKFGNKADLNIGKPLSFQQYYGKENDKAPLRKVTSLIMKEIAKLSMQSYDYDREYLK